MQKGKNRFWMLIITICLCLFCVMPVFAAGIDLTQNGSLTVIFQTKNEHEAVPGAKFTIYKVENLIDENGRTEWTTDFANCGISLSGLSTSEANQAAKDLAAYAKENSITGSEQTTDTNGKATFSNLALGTYLVVLTETPKAYETIDPFLLTVPMEDDAGNTIYDITAQPKTGKLPVATPKPQSTPKRTPGPAPDPTPEPAPLPTLKPSPTPTVAPTLEPTVAPTRDPGDELAGRRLPQTGPERWMNILLFVVSLVVFIGGWIAHRKKAGKLMMLGGVLTFSAMLLLTVYQMNLERESEEATQKIKNAYEDAIDQIEVPEEAAIKQIPYIEIEGEKYIGEISIPVIDISLPVRMECTQEGLKEAPCRYVGSAFDHSLIISAHNYKRHFGNISMLEVGDEVVFTDVEGLQYFYEVLGTEVLGAYDVEEMEEGNWDLTLFTCTYGGRNRVTVRCKLIEEGAI